MRQILNEVQYRCPMKLVESKEPETGVLATVRGTFAQYDVPNRNNRIYEKAVWEKALSDADVLADLQGRRMFGELDHPEDYLDIKIDKTAFCVTDLKLDESSGTIQGELKVLDTPAGKILNTLVRFGSVLGVSSRASGELDEANHVIPESYRFITFDVVTNPSNVQAFPTLTESTDTDVEHKSLVDAISECIATADKTQLGLIRDICKSMSEENAADIINKVELRESELDALLPEDPDTGAEPVEPSNDDPVLTLLKETVIPMLTEVLDILKPKSNQEEEPGVDESAPKAPAMRVPVRACRKVLESAKGETIVSVSRLAEDTEEDGGSSLQRTVRLNKTK